MPAVGPDGTRVPDAQNPAATRYARQMLQHLVHSGLIRSVDEAAAHFGGDVTATWRALSRLTGAPTTTTLGPTGPVPPQMPPPQMPPPQAMQMPVQHYSTPPLRGGPPMGAPPFHELLTRLLGGQPQQGGPIQQARRPFRPLREVY